MSKGPFDNASLARPKPAKATGAVAVAETPPKKKRERSLFGNIEKRGRLYRARYTGPDQKRHYAEGMTSKMDAQRWLAQQHAAILNGTWTQQTPKMSVGPALRSKKGGPLLYDYAMKWIHERRNSKGLPLAKRTSAEYRRLFKTGPLSELGQRPISALTEAEIREWNAAAPDLGEARQKKKAKRAADGLEDKPAITQAAKAYSVLSSICKTAVSDGLLPKQICNIPGAAKASTRRPIVVPNVAEVEQIIEEFTPEFKAAAVLAAWGSTRYGELTELRRKDFEVDRAADGTVSRVTMRITRGVTHTAEDGYIVGETKSEAGVRTIIIPSHVHDIVVEHLAEHTLPAQNALLFPSRTNPDEHLSPSTFYDYWYPVRDAIGQPEMTFHALRHFAGTMYAQAGATLKENQAFLGHSTVSAAMRYQHVAEGRPEVLAERVAQMANESKAARSAS